jgi:hypothetical protein
MNPDLKKYLRTNERLATIVAAEVCTHKGDWEVICFAMQCDDGTKLADRFYVRGGRWSSNACEEVERMCAFISCSMQAKPSPTTFAELIGQQVVVSLR